MQLTQPGLASHALDTNRTLHRMKGVVLQGSCSATCDKPAPQQFSRGTPAWGEAASSLHAVP